MTDRRRYTQSDDDRALVSRRARRDAEDNAGGVVEDKGQFDEDESSAPVIVDDERMTSPRAANHRPRMTLQQVADDRHKEAKAVAKEVRALDVATAVLENQIETMQKDIDKASGVVWKSVLAAVGSAVAVQIRSFMAGREVGILEEKLARAQADIVELRSFNQTRGYQWLPVKHDTSTQPDPPSTRGDTP